MDGWMNGWMDGWMDGWMNGWMDEQKACSNLLLQLGYIKGHEYAIMSLILMKLRICFDSVTISL